MFSLVGELLAKLCDGPSWCSFLCSDAMQFEVDAWFGSSLSKLFPLFPKSQSINQLGQRPRREMAFSKNIIGILQ